MDNTPLSLDLFTPPLPLITRVLGVTFADFGGSVLSGCLRYSLYIAHCVVPYGVLAGHLGRGGYGIARNGNNCRLQTRVVFFFTEIRL